MIQWLIDQASPGLDKSQINSHQESNKFPPPFDFKLNWGDEEESKPNPH
jgi:hypothetical protein